MKKNDPAGSFASLIPLSQVNKRLYGIMRNRYSIKQLAKKFDTFERAVAYDLCSIGAIKKEKLDAYYFRLPINNKLKRLLDTSSDIKVHDLEAQQKLEKKVIQLFNKHSTRRKEDMILNNKLSLTNSLSKAVLNGHYTVAQQLIKAGADVGKLKIHSLYEEVPLLHFILLRHMRDLAVCNDAHKSDVFPSIKIAIQELFRLSVENGADISAKHEKLDVVKTLVMYSLEDFLPIIVTKYPNFLEGYKNSIFYFKIKS